MTFQISSRVVRNLLTKLTGFEHFVFVQSGTAAQHLTMSLLFGHNEVVTLPALGCWTISNAVIRQGAMPSVCDIDTYWGLETSCIKTRASVILDTWSVPSDWKGASFHPASIIDTSLAPGAMQSGKLPGEIFSTGFLSLGRGKPLDIGAGGVALFKSASAAREAQHLLRFGVTDGRWTQSSDRYVFAPSLFPLLENHLLEVNERLQRERDEGIWLRTEIPNLLPGFQSNPIRPDSLLGLRSAIPILLPKDFPLTPQELEAPALMSRIGLSRHPVGTPYLEPAWEGPYQSSAPRSEELSPRLIFFEPKGPINNCLKQLCLFIDCALSMVNDLKMPYSLKPMEQEVVAKFLKSNSGCRICRGIDNSLFLYDEITGMAQKIITASTKK